MTMICFMRTLDAAKTDIHVITMPGSALQHVHTSANHGRSIGDASRIRAGGKADYAQSFGKNHIKGV